jgi:hypothetical protein
MGVSLTVFARAALNHSPPDLCLPNSWNYRVEPPCPAQMLFLNELAQLSQALQLVTQTQLVLCDLHEGTFHTQDEDGPLWVTSGGVCTGLLL